MASHWVCKFRCPLFDIMLNLISFRDQFVLYKNGYGKIVGRFKDMIIRGGENIFPKEIEDHLNTHPKILDCQVCTISNLGLSLVL